MTLDVSRKYLAVPIREGAPEVLLTFRRDGEIVYDIKINPDASNPEYTAYIDVSRFMGQNLSVSCEPDTELPFTPSDVRFEGEGRYTGGLRPHVHFTALRGWHNDPNGLVYADGLYHMFFQHNPAGVMWNNMHWGHAVSPDLVHWEERDVALFTDENGTVFSGGGITDRDNRSGLGKGSMLLYFTSAPGFTPHSAGRRFTQSLAYSADGGQTFKVYPKTIIPHITGDNRDPKVTYHRESNSFVLALFLDGHEYALFTSKNLLDWTEIQRLELPEDAECPDFFPLQYEGGEKWVFIGASDRYMIGDFNGTHFTPEWEGGRLHYGSNAYAAQSWSGLPDGRRVRVSWNTSPLPGMPFRSSMTTPAELTLRRFGNRPCLCAYPVEEFASLRQNTALFSDLPVKSFSHDPGSPATDTELEIPRSCADFTLDVNGAKFEVSPAGGTLRFGELSAPLEFFGGSVHVRVVSDVHAVEVYVNYGKAFMCVGHITGTDEIKITADGEPVLKRLSISGLERVFNA